jgi:hypothetical protein
MIIYVRQEQGLAPCNHSQWSFRNMAVSLSAEDGLPVQSSMQNSQRHLGKSVSAAHWEVAHMFSGPNRQKWYMDSTDDKLT